MIIKHNKDEIDEYLTDAPCFIGFYDVLYIPENELIELIIKSNQISEKITISADGTGLTGSRVPLCGSIISMGCFNKIIHIDPVKKVLTIQPFVRLTEIDDFLSSIGLFYPPNPTEKLSTIGGNIGNNASGLRTYHYGSTRKYVNRLRLILPCGNTLHIKRGEILASNYSFSFYSNEGKLIEFDIFDLNIPKIKHAAGYYIHKNMDLIDLFIGAEGTLGIVTEVELQLLDTPEEILGAIVFFDTHKGMHDYIDYLRTVAINPRLIKFFDDNSLNLLRPKINQIPSKTLYALWIEIESYTNEVDEKIELFYSELHRFTNLADDTWFAQSIIEHRRLAEFRHALPLAVYEEIQKYEQNKLGTDSAVPLEFNRIYHEYMISLFKDAELDYVIWGHIGNAHYHANIITKSKDEFDKAKVIFRKILQKAIDLNGTISAEHGIGKIKKEYFKLLYADDIIDKMRYIKKSFDSNLILNIGNIFDI